MYTAKGAVHGTRYTAKGKVRGTRYTALCAVRGTCERQVARCAVPGKRRVAPSAVKPYACVHRSALVRRNLASVRPRRCAFIVHALSGHDWTAYEFRIGQLRRSQPNLDKFWNAALVAVALEIADRARAVRTAHLLRTAAIFAREFHLNLV